MKIKKFSPVFIFILLTFGVILLSFILSLFNFQAEYSTVNAYTNSLQNNVIQVENILNPSGIKYIISDTVSNFVNFQPLSSLIIILIGIGVLEKSGFAKVFFTLITQNFKKYTITFTLILISIISSVFGEIGFVLMLPLGALLFKYGHRNPLGGIISSFAGVSFGYGINLFINSLDSSLIDITLLASKVVDANYTFGAFFQLFIMLVATIISSILLTRVTENIIMKKLGKYEFDEIETLDKVKFSNKELRGFVLGLASLILYIVLIAYMVIPGLPLSGMLLDDNATLYIDKLFGSNSLFNQGFVFIITFLFIIVGLIYGYVSKSISTNKDVSDSLAYGLDGIGNILILLFVSSLFISVLNKSNIGLVLVALLTSIIGSFKFSGVALIILLFVICIILGLIYPGLKSKWSIMSGTVVPAFMNVSLSPEFAQLIFVAGSTLSMALSPVMIYYVIYVAYLEKYDKSNQVTVFGTLKYMWNYALVILIMWFILLVGFYITGLPIGLGSSPSLKF